ncbi:NAPEP-like protein, partial [Mya arenaria]
AIQRVHPVLDYDFQKVNNPPQDKIQITWIGHATVLVQIEGMNILADPVFSEKCGPAGFGLQLGYTRFRCPACQVEDLPPIHVVLISHNHHDHLDSQSVRDIAKHHPDAKWLVGSGNAKFCKTSGCKHVEEFKWWEPINVGAFTFVCAMVWMGCEKPKIQYYLEPPQELEKQMYNNRLEPKTFFNLQIGETWIVGDDRDYNPPFMAREKTRTQRHNDDPLTQRHGDDPPTHRHGDDQPTQRHGDDPPTQRHGDDPPTQRLNDGPWKLGAVGSNQHVRKGEKVEASGKFTNNAVGEDQDDVPPLKDTDTRITLSLNNVPGELGAAGSNQH